MRFESFRAPETQNTYILAHELENTLVGVISSLLDPFLTIIFKKLIDEAFT